MLVFYNTKHHQRFKCQLLLLERFLDGPGQLAAVRRVVLYRRCAAGGRGGLGGAPVRRCAGAGWFGVVWWAPGEARMRRGVRAGASVSMWLNANKCDLRFWGVIGIPELRFRCVFSRLFTLQLV